MTCVDLFDNWLVLIPTRSTGSTDWIQAFILHYIFVFGKPQHILLDNGPGFTSYASQTFANTFRINLKFISPYNPKANGKCERMNGIVKTCLAIIASLNRIRKPEKYLKWFHYIQFIAYIHNITKSPDTGFPPWTLRWIEPAPTLINADLTNLTNDYLNKYDNLADYFKGISDIKTKFYQQALDHIEDNVSKKYERYLSQHKNFGKQKIQQGSIIFIKNNAWVGTKRKLRPKYEGPYRVLDTSKSDSYLIAPYDPITNTYNTNYQKYMAITNMKLVA